MYDDRETESDSNTAGRVAVPLDGFEDAAFGLVRDSGSAVDDTHVRFRRNEDALGGLGWAFEDLAHAPQVGVAGLHGVADLHDPLDYRHTLTPTTMEWRVF